MVPFQKEVTVYLYSDFYGMSSVAFLKQVPGLQTRFGREDIKFLKGSVDSQYLASTSICSFCGTLFSGSSNATDM